LEVEKVMQKEISSKKVPRRKKVITMFVDVVTQWTTMARYVVKLRYYYPPPHRTPRVLEEKKEK